MLWLSGAVAKEALTVLTAYPEEVVSRFETSFERQYSDIDVQIIWRMPHDAPPYLSQPKQGGVDVYWSAAQRNFHQLKQQGAWQRLNLAENGLDKYLGAMPLIDGDGYYRVTEMAGYGFALNPGYLKQHGLPLPTTWLDLADKRYQDHLALPVPSKVGFAPMMIDSILQQYGWHDGWAVLAGIVANARPVESGATFVTDIIGAGERGIAPTIDFFTASAIANGAALKFIYPQPVAYSPAHIAITASSQHVDAARRFVGFILSPAGQTLLFHPDIRKLPARASVYQDKPADYFDPFAASARYPVMYDPSLALTRLGLNNALFDAMFTDHWQRFQDLMSRLRKLEVQAGGVEPSKLVKIRELLTSAPISAQQAGQVELQNLFANRRDAGAEAKTKDWSEEISRRYDAAEKLLEEALT